MGQQCFMGIGRRIHDLRPFVENGATPANFGSQFSQSGWNMKIQTCCIDHMTIEMCMSNIKKCFAKICLVAHMQTMFLLLPPGSVCAVSHLWTNCARDKLYMDRWMRAKTAKIVKYWHSIKIKVNFFALWITKDNVKLWYKTKHLHSSANLNQEECP